ncbi:MAG: TolC family protein [Bacteroidia bacterium]
MKTKILTIQKPLITLLSRVFKAIFVRNKSCCKFLLFIFNFFILSNAYGQQTISLKTILDSSVINSPSLKEAEAIIEQQKNLVKSSVNLPSPEILLQNPTGNFYTLGVQQVFDFPTVYSTQKKIQRENVKLAQMAKKLTQTDVKYQVSILYSELQYQYQLLEILQKQDSAYSAIAENADRAFKAGTIDFVQSGFAKVQAGQIKTDLILAQANYNATIQNLKTLSGIETDFLPEIITPADYTKAILPNDTGIIENSNMQYAKQQIAINEKRLHLERQKTLPGFTMAYLNQGERTTPFENRFYAGLRIPLWFWQYRGNIDAAKNLVEASKYNAAANKLKLSSEIQSSYTKFMAYQQALDLYKSDILQQATSLTNASNRFFTSGNTSYTDFLRNLNDATEIQKNYWETVKNYNQTLTYIHYLTGKL